MTDAGFDFVAAKFVPGEWVFLEGGSNTGYARIKTVTQHALSFSRTLFTPATETPAVAVRVFFGVVVRNEKDAALIKRRSYQLERTLGDDGDGVQAEYAVGAVANEFTLNCNMADKLTADLTFIALDAEYRTGLEGLKTGTRVTSQGQEAINTSSDVFAVTLTVGPQSEINNPELFAFVTDLKLNIKNNVKPDKAVGTLGAFDVSVGTFEVSGSVTAYFATVESVRAVRANSDANLFAGFARENYGMIFDLPLCGLGG